MPKQFTVDFYQVEVAAPHRFESAIQVCNNLPNNDSRTLLTSAGPIRLSQAALRDGIWEGDMVRIRIDEPAFKASTNGPVETIDMDADEGLGEHTAFLYFPEERILVLQRNRSGVSSTRLASYFQDKGGVGEPIFLNPILKRQVLLRLQNMGEIRRIEVKLAGCRNLADSGLMPIDGGLGRALDMAEYFQAPVAELTFSMRGKQRGTISIRSAIESVQRLLRVRDHDSNAVQKLRVVGRNEDNDLEPLDLLEARVCGIVVVEKSPLVNEFFRRRVEALTESYRTLRSELSV